MVRFTVSRFLLLVLVIGIFVTVNFYVSQLKEEAKLQERVAEAVLKPRVSGRPKPAFKWLTPEPKMPGTIMKEQDIYSDTFDDNRLARVVALRNTTLTKACLESSVATKETLFRFDLARESGKFSPAARPRLLVSDQHKAVYCAIGGAGAENWEAIIERLEKGQGKSAQEFDQRFAGAPTLRELWDFREPAIHHRISEYYKFVFVREPLTRLLSSYKRFVTGVGQNEFAGEFLRWYSNETKSRSKLEAFVDFVLATDVMPGDVEWGMYNDLCAPCFVKYDFIGRYETIEHDANYVLRNTNVKGIQYTDPHTEHFKQNFIDELRQAVPADKFLKLFKKYKLDYQLFGYPQP